MKLSENIVEHQNASVTIYLINIVDYHVFK